MSNRLLYVANARLPSRKAHTYQIVQMCDAFAAGGDDVELVVPSRRLPDDAPTSVDEYYDSPLDFEITRLPCLDLLWLVPRFPDALAAPIFYLQTVTFTLSALLYIMVRSTDLLYTRARLFAVIGAPIVGERLVLETHRRPSRSWVAGLVGRALDRTRGVVVITEGLRDDWEPFTTAPILVEPDGVRLERFEKRSDKVSLRSELGIPIDSRIACYAGSFLPWKGVESLVRAADLLPRDVVVCLVGGTDEQTERLERDVGGIPDSVLLMGHVPPDEVPKFLLASDVLVVPNSADRELSSRYTSPLKLFEYMAAVRPIVASELPSLREILDEDTAFFATPDDPSSLAVTIERALGDDGERRATNARERVEHYSWEARATRIRQAFDTNRKSGGPV